MRVHTHTYVSETEKHDSGILRHVFVCSHACVYISMCTYILISHKMRFIFVHACVHYHIHNNYYYHFVRDTLNLRICAHIYRIHIHSYIYIHATTLSLSMYIYTHTHVYIHTRTHTHTCQSVTRQVYQILSQYIYIYIYI